jgi:hypothetical protein
MGNSDMPDEHGETVDWLSFYRHGHDGEAQIPFASQTAPFTSQSVEFKQSIRRLRVLH